MGVAQGRDLIAGVLYHAANPKANTVELSAASESRRWMTAPVLRMMFDIPFKLLGCQLVLLRVSSNNEHMARQAERFGFDMVRVPRLLGRDEDCLIFTMTDDQWSAHRLQLRGQSDKVAL